MGIYGDLWGFIRISEGFIKILFWGDYMGVSITGGTTQMDGLFNGKPYKMDDWGYPPF